MPPQRRFTFQSSNGVGLLGAEQLPVQSRATHCWRFLILAVVVAATNYVCLTF
jgi:hypothetical protein